MSSKLIIPDMIKIPDNETLVITINESTLKLAPNAKASGNGNNAPIFVSSSYLKSAPVTTYSMPYGLPFIEFERGSNVTMQFINNTSYFSNFHFHGLNTPPDTDGVSQLLAMGPHTQNGQTYNINYKITNNSMFSWYHPHVVFITAALGLCGFFGIYKIVDNHSKRLNKYFTYGVNESILVYADIDLNNDGTLMMDNINNKDWRAQYGMINNNLCINWKNSNKATTVNIAETEKYITKPSLMMIPQSQNLVKISIMNATVSFRSLYLGVCENPSDITSLKTFYYMEVDCSLRNPLELAMLQIAPSERISIIIDLNQFKDNMATLCFYDFDLSDDTASSTVLLNNCGFNPMPSTYNLIPCLIIKNFNTNSSTVSNTSSLSSSLKNCLREIKEIIFGNNSLVANDENYLTYLNPEYFYNIPDMTPNVPTRQVIFNMSMTANPQIDEFVMDQPRVYMDMWNNIDYHMWKQTRNAKYLPTCLFNITGDNSHENYKFVSNQKMTINFLNSKNALVKSVNIIFPVTPVPLNILQWTDLVNSQYSKTYLGLSTEYKNVSDILEFSWSDIELNLGVNATNKNVAVKTVITKNINKSTEYSIQMIAPCTLLLLFGKSIGSIIKVENTTKTMSMTSSGSDSSSDPPIIKNKYLYVYKIILYFLILILILLIIWVGRISLYYQNYKYTTQTELFVFVFFIFVVFYYYQTIYIYTCNSNSNIQLIYPCNGTKTGMKKPFKTNSINATLTIAPNSTYKGCPMGYANENFFACSVLQDNSEKWIFINADNDNNHPLHFHLTSGFANINSNGDSLCLTNKKYNYNLLYSKDTYAIGGLQTIEFYTKFANFNFYTNNNIMPYLGFSIHCHFLMHHDNGMMNQFAVVDDMNKYFPY